MTPDPLWNAAPSFEALYREHHGRLYRFCLGMTREPAVAEDITQEALLRAYLHRGALDPERSPWPWLRKVATRLVYDHARAQRRTADVTSAEGVVADEAGVYADRELVRQMLGALPQRQRAAVTLRYLEDWKSAEIADVLNLPRPAVEQLLLRARRSLRSEYRRLSGDRLRLLLWPLAAWGLRSRQRFVRGAGVVGERGLPSLAATAESMAALVVAGALTVGAGLGADGGHAVMRASGDAGARRIDAIAAGPSSANGAAVVHAATGTGAAATPPRRAPSMSRSSRPAAGSPAERHVDVSASAPAITREHVRQETRTTVERDKDEDQLRASSELFVGAADEATGGWSNTIVHCDSGSKVARATCDAYDTGAEATPDAP